MLTLPPSPLAQDVAAHRLRTVKKITHLQLSAALNRRDSEDLRSKVGALAAEWLSPKHRLMIECRYALNGRVKHTRAMTAKADFAEGRWRTVPLSLQGVSYHTSRALKRLCVLMNREKIS